MHHVPREDCFVIGFVCYIDFGWGESYFAILKEVRFTGYGGGDRRGLFFLDVYVVHYIVDVVEGLRLFHSAVFVG